MKRVSMKEAFGGEVNFTKYISNNVDISNSLLETIDMTIGRDDYRVIAEHQTVDKKRVDLTIQNSEGSTIAVIESQDSNGWLDSVHASKISYYMYEKQCFEGILITEDATEHVKGFVQFMNQNTPFNIWLIVSRIYLLDNGKKYIDFVPIMRPTDANDKKIKRNLEKVSADVEYAHADFLAKKFEEHRGSFSNVTSYYIDKKNVGNLKINAGIEPRKEFMNVTLYHGGKYDTEIFKKSLNEFSLQYPELFNDSDVEGPLFNGMCGRFKVKGWEKSFEIYLKLVEGLESNTIKVC